MTLLAETTRRSLPKPDRYNLAESHGGRDPNSIWGKKRDEDEIEKKQKKKGFDKPWRIIFREMTHSHDLVV